MLQQQNLHGNSLGWPKYPASTALFPRRHFSNFLKWSYLCLLNLVLTIATVWRLFFFNMYQHIERWYKVGRCTPSLPLVPFPVLIPNEVRCAKPRQSTLKIQSRNLLTVRIKRKHWQFLLSPCPTEKKKSHALWMELLSDCHFHNWQCGGTTMDLQQKSDDV